MVGALAISPVLALRPRNLVLAGSSAKSRGAELFATKGCAHCHGPAGVGGGKGPDLQTVRKRRNTEAIITQIHDGGKAMPQFGDELSAGEIEDLAAFLRAKRKVVVVPPKPAEKPAPAPGDKDTN
jgi:mono/diheme cytochrome c family protein